jgi:hypothetical protein
MFCASGLVFGSTKGVGSRCHILLARTHFRWYRGRRLPFSCFALPDSFSVVLRASRPMFMFSAPRHVFDGTEGVGSRFHVLRTRLIFGGRFCGRRVPFTCFALPESFSAVPGASGPVSLFCEPRLIFGGTDGVGSRFHVLRARTHFRRYRGRRVPLSCFALPDSYSAVPRASGPVFIFCAPGLIFGGTEGVGSRINVLRFLTHFRRYRGHRVPFSYFALPDSFSAVLKASGAIFMFFAPRFIFGGVGGVGSHFLFLLARTHFRRYRWRRVPFSCFALPDLFSAVQNASGAVYMFCAPRLVLGVTGGVGYSFLVLLARTHFQRYRWCRVPISYFALPDSFSAVPRASVPVSCFARTDSFSVVPRASGPVFMFCSPRLIFHGTDGVGSRFHVLRAELVFGGTEVVGSRFHVLCAELVFRPTEGAGSRFQDLCARTHFRR